MVAGLGDPDARFKVYIGNRPNYADYLHHYGVTPLKSGDISAIGQACGNGWRKVFNVYAKLLFALTPEWAGSSFDRWQQLRDQSLLQQGCGMSLMFTPPELGSESHFHLVMGKHYAMSLKLPSSLSWLDHEFAIDRPNKLIVCPYFDYRQLSNLKIIHLVELVKRHKWVSLNLPAG